MFICTIELTQVCCAGHELRMGQKRNAGRVLVGKPQRKRPVGKARLRKEDNIKTDSKVLKF